MTAKIACIGVIGKADNPLHISLFPPYTDSTIEFNFLLNSCLDIFDIHQKQTAISQDLGLLHAVDERLAAYGWLTTTGVKFLVVVDLMGQQVPIGAEKPKGAGAAMSGLRDGNLKPVFHALQTAYIQLLQNPFYSPDDHLPLAKNAAVPTSTSQEITNKKFISEVKRIGESWAPGMAAV
ncbi:hypothetical protein SI65_07582 [Aspergillus cristatus]|uniref:Sedlin n=1 Tax=Aspergillus cristatus TaxID=573508 RepID=A0A1E3B886_ASPCR|nr:hypothetical protein SI65_07582 [Aspergillus cristatus]